VLKTSRQSRSITAAEHTWDISLQGIIILLYGCANAVIVPAQPHILNGFGEAPEALYVPPCQLIKLLQCCLWLLLMQDETLQ
jgi:hypothetical protein